MNRHNQRSKSRRGFPASARRFLIPLSACLAAVPVAVALAAAPPAGDPAKGQQIASQVCGACHNADGNSTVPANPRLAALSADYLVKQLTDLAKPAGDKAGRENPVMGGFAMSLSEEDRRNVAAWFSKQTPKPDVARNKETADLGERIYRTGISEKSVPACAGCHGPSGAGLPVLYPRIGGQHADYLNAQLKAFRAGTRRNSLAMEQISFRMNDAEIDAVTDFIAGLRASR